jgi:hypothetical protein
VASSGLKIFSRADWGARPPRGALANAGAITQATVHHGGVVGGQRLTFEHGAATMRSWQAFHQDGRGWRDIGYNFGIDGRGRLYEGRPVGRLPAAVEGSNSNSVAFVFMLDGDRHGLNFLQRRTLKTLFEKGIPERGVAPLKTLLVRGHQECPGHASNACPGAKIMAHLRWRRNRYRK